MIYATTAETKNGNEDSILNDGSFLKFYNDVLISVPDNSKPWKHSIEFEVPK